MRFVPVRLWALRGSTPIGATFRISTPPSRRLYFSKSYKLSLSNSRLTPDLAHQHNSHTPQLLSISPDKRTLNTPIFTELFIAQNPCALLSLHSEHSAYSVCSVNSVCSVHSVWNKAHCNNAICLALGVFLLSLSGYSTKMNLSPNL